MEQILTAASTPAGIAAMVLLGLGVAAAAMMHGQVRAFVASVTVGVAVVLAVIAFITVSPEAEVGAEALAGLEVDVPEGDREMALALATRAEQELNRGDTRAALDSYDRARAAYRKVGDVLGEADVAFGLARLAHFTGQSDRARANYAEALGLYLQGGSAMGQAQVLAAMGDLEKDTFNWAEASKDYRNARAQWARVPGSKSDPHVMLGLDELPRMPEGEPQAREELAQARLIFDQIDDPRGKGDVDALTGALEFNLGDFDGARAMFASARSLYQGTDDRKREAEANLSVALTELHLGFNVEVLAALSFAEGLFEAANDSAGVPRTAIVRGRLELMLGEWLTARETFFRAAAQLRALSGKAEANAFMGLGHAEIGLGNVGEAIAAFTSANHIYFRFRDEAGQAASLLARGSARMVDGRPDGALADLAQAGGLFEELGESVAAARGLVILGRARTATENSAGALTAYTDAAPIFERQAAPIGQVIAVLEAGDLYQTFNRTADAATAYRQAGAIFAALEAPVAEANRYLGFPAVTSIEVRYHDAGDPYDLGLLAERTPEGITAYQTLAAENIAAFPQQNATARALVAELEARVAVALEFANAIN